MVAAMLSTARPAYPATFTVTKTADTNDGACTADCSLREAIVAANAAAGADSFRAALAPTPRPTSTPARATPRMGLFHKARRR